MSRIRAALDYVRQKFPSNHPLIDRKFKTDGKELFIQSIEGTDGDHMHVSKPGKQGQGVFGDILNRFLDRIEVGPDGISRKLYPIGTRYVEIDPNLSSGRPVIKGRGIPAVTLWNRQIAGESVES